MAEQDPIHAYKRPGLRVLVYPNRIEIQKPSFPFGRKTTILLMRNITNVDLANPMGILKIKTADGKTHKLRIGGLLNAAGKIRDAIVSQL